MKKLLFGFLAVVSISCFANTEIVNYETVKQGSLVLRESTLNEAGRLNVLIKEAKDICSKSRSRAQVKSWRLGEELNGVTLTASADYICTVETSH